MDEAFRDVGDWINKSELACHYIEDEESMKHHIERYMEEEEESIPLDAFYLDEKYKQFMKIKDEYLDDESVIECIHEFTSKGEFVPSTWKYNVVTLEIEL